MHARHDLRPKQDNLPINELGVPAIPGYPDLTPVLLAIAEGESKATNACKAVGLHPMVFYQLVRKWPQLKDAYVGAMHAAGERAVEKCVEVAEASGNHKLQVSVYRWLGAKRYSELYGDSGTLVQVSNHTSFRVGNAVAEAVELRKSQVIDGVSEPVVE